MNKYENQFAKQIAEKCSNSLQIIVESLEIADLQIKKLSQVNKNF